MTPIIFVPGIMGTRLALPSAVPGLPNWDPDSGAQMLQFFGLSEDVRVVHMSTASRPAAAPMGQFVALPPELSLIPFFPSLAAALGQTVDALVTARGWPRVAWGTYGVLLTALETTLNIATPLVPPVLNFPVHAFGYDWRLSNAVSGAALRVFIDQTLAQTGSAQAILVTHSMGGLVARFAVSDPTTRAKVKAVVHVAQPANGAAVAYRRCLTGFRPDIDSAGPVQTQFFKNLFGPTFNSYMRLMAGLPSAFELLPNHRYHLLRPTPWLETGHAIDFDNIYTVYDNDAHPGIIPAALAIALGPLQGAVLRGQIQAGLRSAEFFHRTLGDFVHPKTVVLYGTGRQTDSKVTLAPGQIQVDRPTTGDGTVPDESASFANFNNPSIISRTSHPGLEHAEIFVTPNFVPRPPSAATLAIAALIPTL
jgi:pimeloyl-ACP methyl ester carboxylesterase